MIRRRVKILFLINSLEPAGAETFLLNHLRYLDHSCYEPIVCQIRQGGGLLKAFKNLGIEVVSLNEQRRPELRTLVQLYRLLRERQIDILQTHVLYAGIVGRVVGSLARVPVIVSTEQDLRNGAQARRPFIRALNDLTMPLADANVYITEAVANSFKQGIARRVMRNQRLERTIPNGIDTIDVNKQRETKRVAARTALGLGPDHFVIGNVGRLDHQKGQSYLLKAFAALLPALPTARLVIIGWGLLENELKEEAARLGVSQQVLMAGKRTDVLEILPGFDVFAFPSIFEGQGIAILEAMAQEIPVVASRVGGIPDLVVHEQTGLLVQARDIRDLKEAILRVASDSSLASTLVKAARALVEERYSIEYSAGEYGRLYHELSSVNFPVTANGAAFPAV